MGGFKMKAKQANLLLGLNSEDNRVYRAVMLHVFGMTGYDDLQHEPLKKWRDAFNLVHRMRPNNDNKHFCILMYSVLTGHNIETGRKVVKRYMKGL